MNAKALGIKGLLKLALHGLQLVRPFLKMNGEQSAAWTIVIDMLGGQSQ